MPQRPKAHAFFSLLLLLTFLAAGLVNAQRIPPSGFNYNPYQGPASKIQKPATQTTQPQSQPINAAPQATKFESQPNIGYYPLLPKQISSTNPSQKSLFAPTMGQPFPADYTSYPDYPQFIEAQYWKTAYLMGTVLPVGTPAKRIQWKQELIAENPEFKPITKGNPQLSRIVLLGDIHHDQQNHAAIRNFLLQQVRPGDRILLEAVPTGATAFDLSPSHLEFGIAELSARGAILGGWDVPGADTAALRQADVEQIVSSYEATVRSTFYSPQFRAAYPDPILRMMRILEMPSMKFEAKHISTPRLLEGNAWLNRNLLSLQGDPKAARTFIIAGNGHIANNSFVEDLLKVSSDLSYWNPGADPFGSISREIDKWTVPSQAPKFTDIILNEYAKRYNELQREGRLAMPSPTFTGPACMSKAAQSLFAIKANSAHLKPSKP